MRFARGAAFLMVSGAFAGAAATHAFAQEGIIAAPPRFEPVSGIYSTKPDVEQAPATYSTKPQPQPQPALQPWQQPIARDLSQDTAPFRREERYVPPAPAPLAAEPRQVPAGNIPFGRASAEAFAPVPTGPRDVTAAPVEEVGIVSEELAPATAAPAVPMPPKDPTEPTPQTTPIFETEGPNTVPLRHVTLRALNKVTGHTTELKGMTGTVLRFGNLEIIAKSCRKSAPTSQLDYAALLVISELRPDEASKELFSGWMYASSPSLTALEHPVYDVSIVRCSAGKSDAKAEAGDAVVAKPAVKKP